MGGGEARVTHGCGGSLTNTREAGGGSPAGLAKNSGPTRCPPTRETLPYSPGRSRASHGASPLILVLAGRDARTASRG